MGFSVRALTECCAGCYVIGVSLIDLHLFLQVHKESTIITTMNLSLILFLIGILGFILNRKNIILMIISIEIMLLAVTLLVLISSFSFDDNIGQTFSVYIISIAGAESVIGLSILVAYYRSNSWSLTLL